MTQPSADILQRIEALLRLGKQQEARRLLAEYVKSNPSSVRGWWLMSQAAADLDQQLHCLARVLRLDPGNALAREQLERIKKTESQPRASSSAAFIAEPHPPEAKKPSGNAPVVTSREASSTTPQQSPAEKKALPTPVRKVGKESTPAGKPKKKKGIQNVLMAVLLIFVISIAGIYLWSQQKIKAAEAQANSLRETQAVALLLTQLSTLTPSPTWTAPPTRTITLTATITGTATPTPTLELTNTPPPAALVRPEVGYYAPGFSLVQLGIGLKTNFSQFAGKPVLIFFWNTKSTACLNEIDPLKSLYQNYKDQGLVILAIDESESSSTVVTYMNSNHLPYRVLMDQKFATQTKYQVISGPAHFFIDPDGRITYIQAGSMNYKQLESQVKIILP